MNSRNISQSNLNSEKKILTSIATGLILVVAYVSILEPSQWNLPLVALFKTSLGAIFGSGSA